MIQALKESLKGLLTLFPNLGQVKLQSLLEQAMEHPVILNSAGDGNIALSEALQTIILPICKKKKKKTWYHWKIYKK